MCNDKIRLIQEILGVHRRIASIQASMTQAIVTGAAEVDSSNQLELKRARQLRRTLMDQLARHVENHGC